MKYLILDDDHDRLNQFKFALIGKDVTCTENAQECIEQLENNGPWDFVFLDHDLGGMVYVDSGKNTGYEVAQWIQNNPEKIDNHTKFFVHSLNPVGARNMALIIPRCKLMPFAWTKLGK